MSKQVVFFAVALAVAVPVVAQNVRELSLDEALRLAADKSEQLAVARAGLRRASANVDRTESQRKPQLNGSASYQRSLASQFEGLGGGAQQPAPPECQTPYVPDPALPLEERVRQLELRQQCPSSPLGGLDFSQLGFGAANSWNFGLSGSWLLFSGGRVEAQTKAAESLQKAAAIGVDSTGAEVKLDVTQAYFDAQLAEELVDIAERSLETSEETVRLTELRVRAGTQAEFDLLQARVASNNQRPLLIRRRQQRHLAYDRLRQLLEIPLDQPLKLTTPVTAPPAGTPAVADPAQRAPVRQASERLKAAKKQVDATKAQKMPSIVAQSQYGVVSYSDSFDFGDFRDNWTAGAALQIPLFTGGRIEAEVSSARADVSEAEARLAQLMELSGLESDAAVAELEAARATLAATEGTVDEAARGYELARLRYREGVSSQIEVQNARLLLEQARLNRAQAARDVWIAYTRLELLPLLPLGGSGAAIGSEAQPQQAPAGSMQPASTFGSSSSTFSGGAFPSQQGAPTQIPGGTP